MTNARWVIDFGKRKNCGADVCRGNEQLIKLAGLYREDAQEDAPAVPTLVVHLPERIDQPDQPERPALRLQGGDGG